MVYKRFGDYKNAVIQAYEKKSNEGTLPQNLVHHTDANLKKECVEEFLSRYSEKDSETFKNFFGRAASKAEYFKKVNDSKPDLFKPINIFLKKQRKSGTHSRYIEMLAWLINFEPRPFMQGDPYDLAEPIKESKPAIPDTKPIPEPVPSKPENDNDGPKEFEKDDLSDPSENDVLSEETPIQRFMPESVVDSSRTARLKNQLLKIYKPVKARSRSFLAGLVIAVCILVLYFMTKPHSMYWNGNEYKSVAFYQNVDGAFIVPLDTFQLAHQKKINDWSLITRNSIGIVHYSKIDNKVKFYTTGGTNPEDTSRRLLPLTEYMYEKYIVHRSQLK
jgi:hypothetical protein